MEYADTLVALTPLVLPTSKFISSGRITARLKLAPAGIHSDAHVYAGGENLTLRSRNL